MIQSIRTFFQRRMYPSSEIVAEPESDLNPLHIAACALLLELAHADEEFSSAERNHIEAVLRRHFALDEETADTLIEVAEAEREQAIDLYQFTSLIRENYDLGQKTLLAEVMWGLILSDGQIAQHEGWLLRKIANLLDLKPGYLADAKKTVAARLAEDGRTDPTYN